MARNEGTSVHTMHPFRQYPFRLGTTRTVCGYDEHAQALNFHDSNRLPTMFGSAGEVNGITGAIIALRKNKRRGISWKKGKESNGNLFICTALLTTHGIP